MADALAVLQGLAGLLQAAAAQQAPPPPPVVQVAPPAPVADSTVLAQLIGNLATTLGSLAAAQQQTGHQALVHQPAPAQPQLQPPLQSFAPALQVVDGDIPYTVPAVTSTIPAGARTELLPLSDGPVPTVDEFVMTNGLEPWVGEAISMLSGDQQKHVMRTGLNTQHATNLNGVITSRIKEVAPVEQRLQIFIALNGLAEGVVDRLSTLTADQHEKVMESTLKVQKANNPSGVVMRRISDVLRNDRLGIPHGPHMSSPGYRSHDYRQPQLAPVVAPQPIAFQQAAPAADAATTLLTTLATVLAAGNAGNRAVDRSRSRPPPVAAPTAGSGSHVPLDVQAFVEQYRLDWWVGEVLARLSLYQRQNVMTELGHMQGVRNPSGVVMTRVKQFANTQELLTIFIDINHLDPQVAQELWELTEDQQQAVIAPGIYIQNARSSSTAARSRIRHVLAGNDAMGGMRREQQQHRMPEHLSAM